MHFFALNIKILKFAGLWIPLNYTTTSYYYCILLLNTVCVFYSLVFFTIAELLALRDTSANINDLVKNLNMSISFILTFCKAAVWFMKRKHILRIMRTLDETWQPFQANKQFNVTAIVKKHQNIKDKLTYTFFTLALMVPSSACILQFIQLFLTSTNDHPALPYHSYVPFSYKNDKKRFFLAVIYQCLALVNCGAIAVGFDMLHTSIVTFTTCHLDILRNAFRTIRANCIARFADCNAHNLNEMMEKEMVVCMKHLQLILNICSEIEDIFSNLILLQILVSLLVFCTCLYLVSMIPIGTQIFGNELAYMLAIENQLAVYCYSGDNLTFMASRLTSAIYEGDWYSASTKFKKFMIMTMMRMLKPVHLTAGKFTHLTLATFVTIGRGSYSLLALLKNK